MALPEPLRAPDAELTPSPAPDAPAADATATTPRRPEWLAPFLAGFFLLTASLAGFLTAQGYALFQADVAASAAIFAVLALAMSALYVRVGAIGKRILETLLVMLVVDFNSDGASIVQISGALTFAVLTLLGTTIAELLAVFGGITLLAVVAGTAFGTPDWVQEVRDPAARAAPTAAAAGRPAVVHLILDEHVGLGGFPRSAEGQAAQAEARRFFLDRGFRIHPGAYSRHMFTVNAVPDMLNFGHKLADSKGENGMVVGRTRYFERLRELGYALTIYQSDFGEYCSGASEARCVTYQSSSLAPLAGVPNTLAGRVHLIFAKFVVLANSLRMPVSWYGKFYIANAERYDLPAPPGFAKWTNTVAARQVMDRLPGELEKIRPGEALFVHALFPHFPYATRADCSFKPSHEWLYRRDITSLGKREHAYYEQLACLRTLLSRQIDALERSPAKDNFVLVIHGDHGSRIVDRDPMADEPQIDDAMMEAGFSALFAVRHSSEDKGSTVAGTRPVYQLLEALALTEFKPFSVTHGETRPEVVLTDKARDPLTTRALPADWTAD